MVDGVQSRSMSIGQVFGKAFGVISNNPMAVFGIVLLFVAVPQFFAKLLFANFDFQDGDARIAVSVLAMLNGFISLLLTSLAQGALVRATTAYCEGDRASFGECAGIGLRMALPLFGLSILFGLGVGFGMLLLLVPGLILVTMWSVAVPALVAERSGIFGAFRRSRELSAGSRWKILGLILLVFVIMMLSGAVFGVAMFAGGIPADGFRTGNFGIGFAITNIALTTLLTAFYVSIQTALYVELRDIKDGPVGQRLAEVFA